MTCEWTISGGTVLGPEGLAPAELHLEDGRIADARPSGGGTLDATGAWVLIGTVVSCFVLPLLFGLDPHTTDPVRHLEPPGPDAWLGRDSLGRDYLARVLVGGRTSLLVGQFVS